MTASGSCVKFIKEVEGFSSQPYYDYNQYTVGYGTKCPTEKFFDYKANGIPKSEAEALLQEHITNIENILNQRLIDKYNLTITQQQFDALVSFSFNVGTGWITYDSSLRNAILRNADENEIVYAFGLYCTAGGKYSPGLITRRLCEANIFLNGVYDQRVSDAYGYVYYDANGGSLTYRVQGFVCDGNAAPVADAVKRDDTFAGWYPDLTGGAQVTVLTRELTGRTLFARWQSAEAPEDPNTAATTVTVTGDVVNIRSGPGTNYGRVTQVYRNTVLSVSHITQLTSMAWGKVQDGWICLEHTNYYDVINGTGGTGTEPGNDGAPSDAPPDSEPTPPAVEQIPEADASPNNPEVITGIVRVNDLLRIRSGPGTTYPVVGFLFNNKKVEILEQTTVDTMAWGKISRGWVCMDYIITDRYIVDNAEKPDAPQEEEKEDATEQTPADSYTHIEDTAMEGRITADALRIRSDAGTEYSVVGFYYENDVVFISQKVLAGSAYWGKTDKGWINMDYVSDASSSAEAAPPTGGEVKTVIGDCLRIRKEAGTGNRISGLLYFGDTVTVYETITVDGTLWGKVAGGWICMDYVQ